MPSFTASFNLLASQQWICSENYSGFTDDFSANDATFRFPKVPSGFFLDFAHEKTGNRENGAERAHRRDFFPEREEREDYRDDGNEVNARRGADGAELVAGNVPRHEAERARADAEEAEVEPVQRIREAERVERWVENHGDSVLYFKVRA